MKGTFSGVLIPLVAILVAASGCAKHPPTAAPAADAKRSVVATVNGVAITEAALDETVERMRSGAHGMPASDNEDVRKRALDQMIIQELAVQEAARQGVRVEEKDLNAAMKTTTEFGHGEGFEAYLKERHTTVEEVRAQVERRLLLQAMYEKEVRQKVSVTPEEVRKEYDLSKAAYVDPEKATVTDIVFTQHQGTTEMLKKAEEVLAAVKADKDPRSVPSGNIFTVLDRDIDSQKEPLLFDSVRGLKEGEWSGLIESPAGNHILKLVRVIPEKRLTYEEAEPFVERRLRVTAEMKRFGEWQEELRKNAVIELPGESAAPREDQKQTPHP